jgi:hypothetical protein
MQQVCADRGFWDTAHWCRQHLGVIAPVTARAPLSSLPMRRVACFEPRHQERRAAGITAHVVHADGLRGASHYRRLRG